MTIEGIYCGGSIEVSTQSREMRMSHWVYAPKVASLKSKAVLLDLTSELWDLMSVEEKNGLLRLHMRKYPGTAAEVDVFVDPIAEQLIWKGQVVTHQELVSALHTHGRGCVAAGIAW